jgi:hypothetical protein
MTAKNVVGMSAQHHILLNTKKAAAAEKPRCTFS